jgi:large subunit ribosomal protein L24
MIRKGDTITVLTGKDKSKTGKVLKVFEKGRRVLVEKLNMIKKHNKPTQTNPTGGIVEKEAPMNISNVQLFCSTCNKGVRTGVKLEKNKKLRVCKKCGKNI